MKPSISVLVPTRGRVKLLHKMLESLVATASDMNKVEVAIRYDDDDAETAEYLRDKPFLCVVGPRYNGYASLPQFVNELVAASHADLLFGCNDDAEFRTPGWDQKLCEVAARYPDGIFNLGVDTVMNNANFVFPCTSRRVTELCGLHDERVFYNDIWFRDVMAHFDRNVRVPDVVIEHVWAGMSEEQQKGLDIVRDPAYPTLYARCVAEAVEKLRGAVAGC